MAKNCPTCGAANRNDAHFCSSCATPLVHELICPTCGTSNVPTARYCHQCATPLAGAGSPAGLGTGLLASNSMLAGRYLIVQKIGQGGMGAVYQATDTRLGHKLVAVKEMSDAAITDPLEKQQARQAFEQEAQMLAMLNHPNLPRVTDHFSEVGKQYLVMDFIEGRTLEEVLEQTPGFLDEKQVVDWGVQLCEVLDYLHNQQPPVIFRDLKPDNIMLDQDGKVKLIDFGIARLFKPGKTTDTASFGTAGYAPPEQYGQGQTDARSDIYALGATLHHLLTKHHPAQTPFNFLPVRSLNPNISEALDRAILCAVERNSDQRWQSAREMQRALVTPQVAPPAPPPVPAPVPASAGATPPPARAPSTPPRVSTPPALRPGYVAVVSTPPAPAPAVAMNRWLVMIGALMVQLCLGVIYAWSVFLFPISRQFGWELGQVTWAYSLNILTFSLVMAYAGRLQDRLGPRTVCMIGGVIMGVGFILASFTTTLWWLILTYGVIVGAGISMSYVTPIATLIKWFPDMRGLMTGVAVAGFGLSTFFLGLLAQRMVEAIGVVSAFRYLGIAFIIIVVAGAQFLRNPPAGWATSVPTTAASGADYTPGEVASMPQGLMLWAMFLCHATAGLMVIGFLFPLAMERGMTAAAAAGGGGLAALFNGAGRIGGGWLSDKIGRRAAMVTLFGATTVLMFITPLSAGTTIGLILAAGVIYFTYGSNFALFPSTVADFFGTRNVGANYGLIFTAWGFAGVVAGLIGARVYAATGAYTNAFYIAAVLALVAAGLATRLRPP